MRAINAAKIACQQALTRVKLILKTSQDYPGALHVSPLRGLPVAGSHPLKSARNGKSGLISITQKIQTLICQVAASASEW